MEKTGIITESTADLPLSLIEENKIAIVPVKLDWPDIEFLPGENTFQKMREAAKRGIKSFGKTSQPSPKDYLDQYKSRLEIFNEVVCISLSSKLSGSYNSAVQAKNFLNPKDQNRIFNIDCFSVSAGQGLAVLEAAEMIKTGKSAQEIKESFNDLAKRIQFFTILKDYKWLEASGRISRLAAIVLKRMANSGLRPLLKIKNGKLFPAGIKNKTKDFADVLFKQVKSETQKKKMSGKKIKIAIIHGDDVLEAERLEKMIKEEIKEAKISFLSLADDVLGIVAGPDAMAVAWLLEN